MYVHPCGVRVVSLEHGALGITSYHKDPLAFASPVCTQNVGPSTKSVIPIHYSLRASVARGTARYAKRLVESYSYVFSLVQHS